MFTVKKQRYKCLANIEGEMTIYTAMELKEKLMPALADKRPLEINLSNVTEMDSAGVQLLMLAKKERAANEHKLTLTDHSDTVVDVFELMDLVSYFNDPVVLPGSKGGKHGS
jgi:anti-sigma B factor antagonist